MASNKGVWIMVGGGLVVGLGIAIFVIVFVGKRGEDREMRAQVKEWGVEYDAARGCLTGTAPLTADPRDAVALRDATSDGALRTCLAYFQKGLDRPGDTSVRNSKVEAAWLDLDKAVGGLAQAFARRIDSYNSDEVPRYRAELGDALATVDAKYNELRAAAGLDAWTPPGGDSIAKMGARTKVAVDGKPLPPDDTELIRHAVVVRALLGDTHATTLAVIDGPDAVSVTSVDPSVVRAADETPWGVRNIRNEKGHYELRAGGLTADGSAADDGVAVAATASPEEDMATLFATGSGAERAIVYWLQLPDETATLWLARSHDAGATWPDNTMLAAPAQSTVSADHAHRRIDFVYPDYEADTWAWLAIRGDDLAAPPQSRPTMTLYDGGRNHCLAGSASWWLSSDNLRRLDTSGGRADLVTLGATELVDCDEHRALLALDGKLGERQFILCDQTTCKAHMKVPQGDHAPLALLGETLGVVVVTQVGALMLVWRIEGDRREFDVFRASDDTRPTMLQESGGALFALYVTDTAIEHAALPL